MEARVTENSIVCEHLTYHAIIPRYRRTWNNRSKLNYLHTDNSPSQSLYLCKFPHTAVQYCRRMCLINTRLLLLSLTQRCNPACWMSQRATRLETIHCHGVERFPVAQLRVNAVLTQVYCPTQHRSNLWAAQMTVQLWNACYTILLLVAKGSSTGWWVAVWTSSTNVIVQEATSAAVRTVNMACPSDLHMQWVDPRLFIDTITFTSLSFILSNTQTDTDEILFIQNAVNG